MPYKDPERKRQWERENREHRNALRRAQRITAEKRESRPTPTPDPTSEQKSGWKTLLGFAVGLGVVFLAAMNGIGVPDPGAGPSPGSGS
jgi:ferric-dicitrate binding protein FerR (iron transport regulator)